MSWQDWLGVLGFVGLLVEMKWIFDIRNDDREMRKLTEQSVALQRQSVEHTREYLAFRRKLAEARERREAKKRESGLSAQETKEPTDMAGAQGGERA